jgi:hypothetical protein
MAATLNKTGAKFHKKTQPACERHFPLMQGAARFRVVDGFAGESC